MRDRKEKRIPVVMGCHRACLLDKQWSYPEDDRTSIGSEQVATVGQTPTAPATAEVGQQDCTHKYHMIAPAAGCDENEGVTDVDERDVETIADGERLAEEFTASSPERMRPREHFRRALVRANEIGTDCVVVTGDIIHVPSAANLEAVTCSRYIAHPALVFAWMCRVATTR